MDACAELGVTAHAGSVISSDLFYPPAGGPDAPPLDHYLPAVRLGVLAVEMEAAGLYGVAAQYGAAALAICTVSDHLATAEHLSAAERQTSFDEMVSVALRAVASA
jgi:purine-nucleoside phosphorylase